MFFSWKESELLHKALRRKKLQEMKKVLLTFGHYEDLYCSEAFKGLHASSVET